MQSYCRPCTSAIARCYSRNSASVVSTVVSTRAVVGGVSAKTSPSAPQTARDEGRETAFLETTRRWYGLGGQFPETPFRPLTPSAFASVGKRYAATEELNEGVANANRVEGGCNISATWALRHKGMPRFQLYCDLES
jgi:hypothetical protein